MYHQIAQRDDFCVIHERSYDSRTDYGQVEIDNELGRGIEAGDADAEDLFVLRWRRYVERYVRGRLFDYNPADAEEIANDVFFELFDATARGCWRREANYVAFFHGVMRLQTKWKFQRLYNRRKRAARDRKEFARDSHTFDETMDYIDFDAHLEAALLTLKPKMRMVFILRHIEGYKRKDIARMLKMPYPNVAYHDKTACERLQKLLADYRR